ncbi:hypothetical protein [Erythrobacter sp. JK5]|uniref:hypothetical protein n=1 Tax=Erythrobacter sp. JK5 TaxID=2829500 RepID=UPI002013B527|nr:hypothetical protein [Erythrobacter sp. JK5]
MREGESVSAAALAPVTASERIGSLDFIRGIAVMGILAANIVAFGQPFQAYMYPDAFLTEHGPVSDWLLIGQLVLIDGKMRGLFTLLFGPGCISSWSVPGRVAALAGDRCGACSS